MRWKRMLGWAGAVVVSLVVGLVALLAAVAGDGERVASYWALARVPVPTTFDDGRAVSEVLEVIDYEFGAQSRHGIFRDVPGLDRTAAVEVTSLTAPTDLAIEPAGTGLTRLRVGDPARTITGRHRYVVEYPLRTLVADNTVSWNAVGTGWAVGIDDVEAHLVAGFDLVDPRCFAGGPWSTEPCDDGAITVVAPGHLRLDVDSVDAGNGVTVEARLGAPLASFPATPDAPSGPAPDPGHGLLRPLVAALLAALAGTMPGIAAARRAGREQVGSSEAAEAAYLGAHAHAVDLVDIGELAEMVTVEFVPPDGLTPAMGGIVIDERVDADHVSAWLLQQAVDGAIELERHGKVLTVRRVRPAADAADEAVLVVLFNGRPEVDLRKYDRPFAAAMKSLRHRLGDWQEASGLWSEEADRRRDRWMITSVAVVVAGVLSTAVGAAFSNRWGGGWLTMLVLAAFATGLGSGVLLRSWELHVRTPHGSAAWLRTASFRRFLAESEAQHVEWAAERGVLREYTAWAVALGQASHWAEVAAEVSPAVAASAADDLWFAHHAPIVLASYHTASTPPSSSGGGGGGGGGSVGGGGGGGGGGSW